jgi:signal transduction histidine kinase/DNA-binding response OmpR family regulator
MGERTTVDSNADPKPGSQEPPADASAFPLVQYLPIGVLVQDEQGVVSLANQALLDSFGLSGTSAELIGRPFAEVNADLAARTLVPELLLSDTTDVAVSDDDVPEGRIDLVDDRVLVREVLTVSVSAGQRRVYLYRDATAEIRAGESEVRARERAEEIAEQRAWLLSMVSHEVRTPLSGVVGLVELLMGEDLPDYIRDIIAGIRRSADSVTELLENLLVISRLDAGKFELDERSIDIHELLESAVETVGPDARLKGLALSLWVHPSVPQQLRLDSARFRQVLLNLLSNAVKFTDSGEIAVSAEAVDESLRVRVIDSGAGIDVAQLDRLFGPYEQGSGLQERGGAGLGLTIVRTLLDRMGGDVEVDSRPGMGTAFRISLPIVQPVPAQMSPIPDLAGARVVLKCSQPLTTMALVTQLRSLGLEVLRDSETASGQAIHAAILVVDGSQAGVADELTALQDRWHPAKSIVLSSGALTEIHGATSGVLPIRQARLGELLRVDNRIVSRPVVAPEPAASADLGLRVLVAEDSPANQALLRTMLAKIGVLADLVPDGEAAVAAATSERYDAVLMDVSMPRMDGIEATRGIRDLNEGATSAQVPIIGLSAATLDEDRNVCLAAGMSDYLTKPVSLAGLRDALSGVVPSATELPEQRLAGSKAAAVEGSAEQAPSATDASGKHAGVILDVGRLRALADEIGDFAVVAESITIYLEELQPRLVVIEEARNDPDHAVMARALHTLVSPSAMLGAEQLATVCREIEQGCGELAASEIHTAVEQIRGIAEETERAMRDYLQEVPA